MEMDQIDVELTTPELLGKVVLLEGSPGEAIVRVLKVSETSVFEIELARLNELEDKGELGKTTSWRVVSGSIEVREGG